LDCVAVGTLGSLRHKATVSLTRDWASLKICGPNPPFETSAWIRYRL